MRASARAARAVWQRLRFRLWVARLDIHVRRRGGRVILDAPYGIWFDSPPRIRAVMAGEGDGTLTMRIGRGVRVGRDLQIEVWALGTNVLELGDDAYVLDGVRVLLRSGTVAIGARTNVRDYAVLKSQGRLEIGADSQVSYHSVIHCHNRVTLAERVIMAERVTIVDSEKRRDGSDEPTVERPLRVAPVSVERNVFVAAGAVIAAGSHIGRNSTVAANAVLTGGTYPGGWVIAGAPAHAVKPLGQPVPESSPQ
jgi:carbonic anhydrase/acetyltransferase-like protein (isoleucine patch superfamily)